MQSDLTRNLMEEAVKNPAFGPPKTTFLTLVLKTAGGLGGGIAGTLVLLGVFLLANSILEPSLAGGAGGTGAGGTEGGAHPLFVFVFMAMIFAAAMTSNLVTALFFTFIESDRYKRGASAIYQIFVANIVILVVMAPMYLIATSLGIALSAYAAALHIIMSALCTLLILEIIGNIRHALLGVYSVIFGILISTGILLTFYQFTQDNPVTILFLALPIIWSTLGFVSGILGLLYQWLYTLYDFDFLATDTSFGDDYGVPEKKEALKKDVSGASFLSGNQDDDDEAEDDGS